MCVILWEVIITGRDLLPESSSETQCCLALMETFVCSLRRNCWMIGKTKALKLQALHT